ncbi:MAG: phenylalanine--tRNA ligase subunit alpha [Myxococcota bacterium]
MSAPEEEDPVAAIDAGIAALGASFQTSFAEAPDEVRLREAYAALLGKKKGALTKVLSLMRHVPAASRRDVGTKVNDFKQRVETAFAARLSELARDARRAELAAPPFDLTLPGRLSMRRGHLHPVLQTRDDLLRIFCDLGFEVVEAPEVETETNNFTKLGFPPDHPATDMQDTFWVDVKTEDGTVRPDARTLLRTHTSNAQSRILSERRPPLAIVNCGAVYRRDDDLTHSPMFHQLEAFMVDESVQMSDLKGVLHTFADALYGPGTSVRLRPSYFPFVEPGAEVDLGCPFCTPETRAECRVCKGTGWLEVLGCGMIHPVVLEACGIDPQRYQGYALGMGIERLAMLRYDIPTIKVLFENDPRFLSQF